MQLHDYQLRGVEHLRRLGRAGLFMEMGLGKTATALEALEPRHLPALVIAPKRVAEMVWPEERDVWRRDLSIVVAKGDPKTRERILNSRGHDITVIGRDNIADVPLGQFRTVILDELSSFKDPSSARTKAAKKICARADYVWGLTGTPAPNGYIDLWAQMLLIDRGAALGTKVTDYRSRYFIGTQVGSSRYAVAYELRPGAQQRLDDLMSTTCLSMIAADHLDLEEPLVNEIRVPNTIRGLYKTMKRDLVVDLSLIGDGAMHTAANAAVLSGRLSQMTAGFLYKDITGGVSWLHNEKTKAVQEAVDGTGSPVLVFYRFLEEVEKLRKALPRATTVEEAGSSLQRDWNAGRIPVLLAHPASIGHGLNLQRGPGHTMVFTSPPWSLEEYLQSVGRLARQGQQKRVTVHHVVVPDTIDSVILDALRNKRSVQDALLRYLAA